MSKEVNLQELEQRLAQVEKQLEKNQRYIRGFKYVIFTFIVLFLVTFGIGLIQFISAG